MDVDVREDDDDVVGVVAFGLDVDDDDGIVRERGRRCGGDCGCGWCAGTRASARASVAG
jgi:hypothetical protein